MPVILLTYQFWGLDAWVVDSGGNVTQGGGSSGGGNTSGETTEEQRTLENEMIKDALKRLKEEIDFWLSNNDKGPLDEEELLKLLSLPDCLPKDADRLQLALDRIAEYLENPESLLSLINEGDTNKARIEELVSKPENGEQSPYEAGLTEEQWNELITMICPYLIEEEERPELVSMEPITDDQFAAGIDNDKLKITYSITTTEKYPLQYAKLEVYKNDGTLAYVKSEGLEIGEGKEFEWDGQVNQNVPAGDKVYMRSDESPFTIKVIASIGQDFADPFQTEIEGSVHPDVDAFLDNYNVAKYIEATGDMGKFEYYQQLATFMFDEVTSDQTDLDVIERFTNPLDYLGAKVRERIFLGREVVVHDHYWAYLEILDGKLTPYHNHSDYTMGNISIRFQRGSNKKVSNHSYGMALDVKDTRNPYLEAPSLYFLQLLTDFKFYQNPSNPEDLKAAHDQLVGFAYQQADIASMKTGFEHLNQSSLKEENFETLLNEILGTYGSSISTFAQLVSRNTNLRNEVHFFNQRTPQEIAEIERQLFEELPSEADALMETIKTIKSTQEINQLYDLYKEGYSKAFLLDKHITDEHTALLAALDNLKNLFGFEVAIISLTRACQRPDDGDYTNWTTYADISSPQSVPETSTLGTVGTFIESRKTDYREIFTSSNYSGVISLLNSSATSLAQNGFMLMSADFAREFLDTGNGDIGWGGNWKGLKDFMHLEYIADDKF